jgi:hypothetical protein
MRLVLAHQPATQAGAGPYRLLDEENLEIARVQRFSPCPAPSSAVAAFAARYAYDLLHFAR